MKYTSKLIKISLLACGSLLLPSSVLANDLPRYDVGSYCDEVADVSGGSMMIKNGCIDMEQTNYNDLKRSWSSLPGGIKKYCDEVAKVSGGSYMILKGCVDMELQESSNQKAFKY